MNEKYERQFHTIEPVYAPDSRVLILGSFPSVRSRGDGFFYAHPQNRFWRVLAAVLEEPVPETVPEKKEMLLRRRIALWDVCASCEVRGSSDSSIRAQEINDVPSLIKKTQVRAVFTNGAAASALYRRFLEEKTGIRAEALPSTSPANAAMKLDRLIEVWCVIGEALAKQENNLS